MAVVILSGTCTTTQDGYSADLFSTIPSFRGAGSAVHLGENTTSVQSYIYQGTYQERPTGDICSWV